MDVDIFDPMKQFRAFVANQKADAAARNARAVDAIKGQWQQQLAANVASREKRAPLAYPEYAKAPRMEVVDDNGETSWTDFPNLIPPEIPPEMTEAVSNPLRSPNAGPDPLKVIQFQLSQLTAAVSQLTAKVDAIAASLQKIGVN